MGFHPGGLTEGHGGLSISPLTENTSSSQGLLPMPSLLECSSSIRGADAPSLSMISADTLSTASSHRTPAATRFTLSTGE